MRTRFLILGVLAGSLSMAALHAEDRSINGSGNNLGVPIRGAANTAMIRFNYQAEFLNSSGAMITDAQRANARDISNAVCWQPGSHPNNRNMSSYVWAWGQFLTHDTDLITSSNGAATNGSAPIAINSPQDPLGPNSIPFTRANFTISQTRGGGRVPVNEVTSYIDASNVYGSDTARAAALRTDGGTGARLIVGPNNLLPFNTQGLANDNEGPLPNDQMFVAGDIRSNENPLLTSLHTVFAREHNRLADVIASQQSSLSPEQQYQLARKIIGAEVQAITYREFLPALLGSGPTVPRVQDYHYASNTDASITTAFSVAAFRFGHSAVPSQLPLVNNDGTSAGSIALRDAFFNPTLLANEPGTVNLLLKGAAVQRSEEIDTQVVDDLRSSLFGPPGAGGLDLAALNIQRGRDVGLPSYNALRPADGLPKLLSFSQITTNPTLAQGISTLYGGNINNVDAWVGALAEDHVAGASVGPLIKSALENQFLRLRDGDRLFYRGNDAGLYVDGVLKPEIASIIDLDHLRLTDVIQANTSVDNLQSHVFFVPVMGDYNGDGQVDAADYTVWRDTLGSTAVLDADGNNDRKIGPEDYAIWVTAMNQCAGAGSGAAGTVPEPCSMTLALAAVLALNFLTKSPRPQFLSGRQFSGLVDE